MKLAVAACVAIGLFLLSLSVKHALTRAAPEPAAPKPLARAAPTKAEKRALAGIDRRLNRRLRALAGVAPEQGPWAAVP